METLVAKLKNLKKALFELESKLDLETTSRRLLELEAKSVKSDFWQDMVAASTTMEKISLLRERIEGVSNLKERIGDALELAEGAESESIKTDLEKEVEAIAKELENLELSLFLSGRYDPGNAFLAIHAGQGGVEAMDWAGILLRMYLRFTERKDWKAKLIDETAGEEAGIKSATVEIGGSYAYGFLKNEAGTHRLVRQSPFNADRLRQTSFALVEVLPVIEDTKEIEISPEDLVIETFRSSGPGGQNVQKVETAVRIRHKPTGIVVSTQSQRSQIQNKENALKVLRSRLFDLRTKEKRVQEKKLKGEYKTASWGNQIRSYVLHPYKMVKDLRTEVETDNPIAVLDGNLNRFVEAEIKLESNK